MGVSFRIVVEQHQFDDYAAVHGAGCLLVLPQVFLDTYDTCDDLGATKSKGPGAARNFAMAHSRVIGAKYHWVMDDNLHDFHRLHENLKIPCRNDAPLAMCERLVKRYENVPLSGLNYYSFCKSTDAVPPFVLNTRIYSCLLIRNDIGLQWRGRYNEDTDLSLRVLKRGDCTIQLNAFLCGKVTTQRMKGGNTDEFYDAEGTKPKSQMIADLHPDCATVVWKFNRWHHNVNYKRFKQSLKFRPDYDPATEPPPPDLKLVEVDFARKDEKPEMWD